jgi:hypothetical protein
MNYQAAGLLEMVDKWKFKLRDKLQTMTVEQRAAFWQETHERARAAGLPVAGDSAVVKPLSKRRGRATG